MKDIGGGHSTRHLRVPEEDRQLAVAIGGAWIPNPEVRDPMPYDAQLVLLGSDGAQVDHREWQKDVPQASYGQPRQMSVDVSAGDSVRLEVRTGPDGSDGRIGLTEWRNSDHRGTRLVLTCGLGDGALKVSMSTDRSADGGCVVLDCPL
jgi:hypothetical protein